MKNRAMKPEHNIPNAPHIDVLALYQRQHEKKTDVKGRRLDSDQRAEYIKQAKERLGLNERVLALSSKRSTHGGELRQDLPYLEFNGFFNKQHGQHIFQPHEMQWSLDQFLERMNDTREEADRRTEAALDQKYGEFNQFLRRLEETSNKMEAAQKAEKLRQRFGEIAKEAGDIDEEAEKYNDKNKIF